MWKNKTDHRLIALYERAEAVPEGSGRAIAVYIRFRGAIGSLDIPGLKTGTVAGNVATGSIILSELPRIAGREEVEFIELIQVSQIDI